MLPEFSLHYIPQIAHAKEDKIDVHLSGWGLTIHPETLTLLRRSLAPPNDNNIGSLGWLFRLSNDFASPTWSLDIRKPRGLLLREEPPEHPYPLFTGKLLIRVIPSDLPSNMGHFYGLSASLHLNALRFAHHFVAPRPTGFARQGHEKICHAAMDRMAHEEISLDSRERDNFIPMGSRQHAFANDPTQWESKIRAYLTGVKNALHTELDRAAQIFEAPLVFHPRLSVRRLEVAFDFSSENPLGVLHVLEPILRRVATRYRSRNYQPRADLEIDANCPCWTFEIARGISIRFYAKTTQRLRLEVCYDFTRRREGHVFDSEDGALQFLRERRLEAVTVLTDFFQRLNSLNPPSMNPASPFDFLARWFQAMPARDVHLGIDLLRILAYNGAIRLASRDRFRRAVLELRRRGLLHHTGGCDVPTPAWVWAMNGLRPIIMNDSIRPARRRNPPCRVRLPLPLIT